MRIAVDAMGGDYAPSEIVKGAAQGSLEYGVDVVLVGDEAAIRQHLTPEAASSRSITIHHASEAIGMGEHAAAVRTKRDASVVVAANLVKDGEADAMVSVGNTAAAMAVATLKFRPIPGIDRPAIAAVMPGKDGPTILLDAGAVVECTPENLLQFGVMGSIYAEKVLHIRSPRVGLLSVGEERSKGCELTKLAHEELEKSGLNFIGNVEGRDLFSGTTDVMVADGFVGNVALKVSEGLGEYIESLLREHLGKSIFTKIPALFLMPAIKKMKKELSYDEYGGAPLLGLNHVCIIGHGRSNAKAVANTVRAAKEAVGHGVVEAISNIASHPVPELL